VHQWIDLGGNAREVEVVVHETGDASNLGRLHERLGLLHNGYLSDGRLVSCICPFFVNRLWRGHDRTPGMAIVTRKEAVRLHTRRRKAIDGVIIFDIVAVSRTRFTKPATGGGLMARLMLSPPLRGVLGGNLSLYMAREENLQRHQVHDPPTENGDPRQESGQMRYNIRKTPP
jgi:hypothetical protein